MGNPVRKIKSRTRGVRGHFFSLKNNRRIDYESLNEQSLMKVLETDPNIISYCEQPLQLETTWNGKRYPYTPDILATDYQSQSTLYEVKPQSDLDNDDGKLANKFRVAEQYCLDKGWTFKVITEDVRTSPEFVRADTLFPHLMDPSIDTNLTASIFKRVQTCAPLQIKDIYTSANWGNPNYCALMHLIGSGQLVEEPYCSFEPDSRIRLASYYEE